MAQRWANFSLFSFNNFRVELKILQLGVERRDHEKGDGTENFTVKYKSLQIEDLSSVSAKRRTPFSR